MPLTTLKEKIEQNSKEIYARYKNTQVFTPITPGTAQSRSRIKDDTQLLPVVSVQRDVKLLSEFLKTGKGKLFIGKQLLLQTGNTFAETRLYNPTSPITNLIPSLHLVRHFGRPLSNFKTPTRENRGALQKETVNGARGGILQGLANAVLSSAQALNYTPEMVGEFYKRPEDSYVPNGVPLFTRQSLTTRGFKKPDFGNAYKLVQTNLTGIDIGNYNNLLVNRTIRRNEPKFNGILSTLSYLNKIKTKDDLGYPISSVFNLGKVNNKILTLNADVRNNELTSQISAYTTSSKSLSGSLTFKKLEQSTNKYFLQSQYVIVPQPNSSLVTLDQRSTPTSLQDPYNLPGFEEIRDSDIINFKFSGLDAQNQPFSIRLRAFISAIKETVKPEFSEQRYIGRTERFVTYSGARRTVQLSFNMVTFSSDEKAMMWDKLDKLTGLAFPRGASSNGFMIPPLFKTTIGGIYQEQPTYIESLDYEFLDKDTTFDVDSQTPMSINVQMSLVLLEKRSRFFDSPFYAISGA